MKRAWRCRISVRGRKAAFRGGIFRHFKKFVPFILII